MKVIRIVVSKKSNLKEEKLKEISINFLKLIHRHRLSYSSSFSSSSSCSSSSNTNRIRSSFCINRAITTY